MEFVDNLMETEDDTPLSEEELRSKVNEYIRFIDDILQPELEKATARREETEFEIQEYSEVKDYIEILSSRMRKNTLEDDEQKQSSVSHDSTSQSSSNMSSMIDMGCQMVYCQAKIANTNQICIDVGLGVHVQLSLEEALDFIRKRIKFLNEEILPKRVQKAKVVAGHLEDALSLLESLSEDSSRKK
mmetsp:Transcript_10523/g.12205  ORF Transcript_10523/g.12205 Transcript_10523/m.12205 type:complete len:187 (-) Transcript_10523:183-743(-)